MNTNDSSNEPRIRELFSKALALSTDQERSDYLDKTCGDDHQLRAEIESLLAANIDDGFLQEPAIANKTIKLAPKSLTEGPRTNIGPYKLLQKIGEGGFGVVYMADQKQPVKRRVALKIIKLGMDTQQVVARFEAERQALAMMEHPNIANVLDAGATDSGRPFFVMELVKGISVTKYCDENNLTTQERLQLFLPICKAIQHAHQKGVIHRDIKPSNIMITLHDGTPVPKVIDFGIAKATQQELTEQTIFTQYGEFIGTPTYMSPEQAEMSGLDIDTRSDIYSLGVLLYELLTGHTPLEAEELLSAGYDEVRRRIREEEPPKPSTRVSTLVGNELTHVAKHRKIDPGKLSGNIRGDLDWIVMKALEKDRTRRYETPNELVADVNRFLNHEPVLAVAPTLGYQLLKLYQKNRTTMRAVAAAAVLLASTTAISLWLAAQATRAEGLADNARDQAKTDRQLALEERDRAEQQKVIAEKQRDRAEQQQYYANIALVDRFIENGSIDRAKKLLLSSPAQYRNWEWGHFLYLCHQERFSVQPFANGAPNIAISPDNRFLAAVQNPTLKVWDIQSGRELYSLDQDNDWAQFSPTSNWLLVKRQDSAQMLDGETGRALYTIGESVSPETVANASFSPDGNQFVTSNKEKDTATIHDTKTGEVDFVLKGSLGSVQNLFFSSDGRQVVSQSVIGGEDRTIIHVWDASTGEERFNLKSENGDVMTIGPRARFYSKYDDNRELQIWDNREGKAMETEGISLTTVRDYNWTSDGRFYVVHRDERVESWDPGARELGVHFLTRAPGLPQSTQDGKTFATLPRTTMAEIWDGKTGEKIHTLKGHSARVSRIILSQDGRLAVTASISGEVKVWSIAPGRTRIEGKDWFNDAVYSPDGNTLAVAGWDRTVTLFDSASGKPKLRLEGHWGPVTSAAFSPDGSWLVTGGMDNIGRVWNAKTGQLLFTLKGHEGGILRVAISPNGRRIATASWDTTARVWDATTGEPLHRLEVQATVIAIAFSPTEPLLATGSIDNLAKIWDIESGRKRQSLSGHEKWVFGVDFDTSGEVLASSSNDGTIRLWDVRTGQPTATIKARTGVGGAVRFSHDGSRLFSIGNDFGPSLTLPTLDVWDPKTGQELVALKGHPNKLRGIAVSPTGMRIASVGRDGVRQLEGFPWRNSDYPGTGGALTERRIRLFADHYWRERYFAENEASDVEVHTVKAPIDSVFQNREAGISSRLIDLSSRYNGALTSRWTPTRDEGGFYEDDLIVLPRGPVWLRNVMFDVRGLIQLARDGLDFRKFFPKIVNDIRIDQKARYLHFLHACVGSEEDGAEIGDYLIHYADGTSAKLKIIYGEDVLDWWLRPNKPQFASDASVAWRGFNFTAHMNNASLQIFEKTYENPKPEVPIARIDFESAITKAAPFLISLTVTDESIADITSQPEPKQAAVHETVSFSVQAKSDVPLIYQWYHDDTRIANATNATITLKRITPRHAGRYQVAIRSQRSGSVVRRLSEPAFLTVIDDQFSYGRVKAEFFTAIAGSTLKPLTTHPNFPDHPDEVRFLDQMELPLVGEADTRRDLGVKISGYLIPPLSGEYQFYLSSFEQGALFLSEDDDPAHKKEIAVEVTGTGLRTWTAWYTRGDRKGVSQPKKSVSEPIPLQGGSRYYIEALMKIGKHRGNQSLGVAWKMPSGPEPKLYAPPIPGRYLGVPRSWLSPSDSQR